jgi:hypothetical protein
MIDQLGGWSSQSVGQAYGDGFGLELLYRESLAALNQF